MEFASLPFRWPADLLTTTGWRALPEFDWPRVELVEGVLTITAPLPSWHQRAIGQLCRVLIDQLPADVEAIHRMAVDLGGTPPTVRIPDIVVIRTNALDPDADLLEPGDLTLVVEIVCDGTRRIDGILKLAEYAEAGIPRYWIVEGDTDRAEPTTLHAYTLVDGSYELSGEHSGRAVLDVAGHRVELDLDALVRR